MLFQYWVIFNSEWCTLVIVIVVFVVLYFVDSLQGCFFYVYLPSVSSNTGLWTFEQPCKQFFGGSPKSKFWKIELWAFGFWTTVRSSLKRKHLSSSVWSWETMSQQAQEPQPFDVKMENDPASTYLWRQFIFMQATCINLCKEKKREQRALQGKTARKKSCPRANPLKWRWLQFDWF